MEPKAGIGMFPGQYEGHRAVFYCCSARPWKLYNECSAVLVRKGL